jgi:predicted enzyme related to lactoylglutathione lyase
MRMKKEEGRITRLWLAMIRVSDMDRALRFYNEILGLPVALDARGFDHAEVGPSEPLAKIGLHDTGKKPKRKRRTGIVLDTDDIYALYERLKKRGVKFTLKPTKMPWGDLVADFLDPDNNELEVVQDPKHHTRKYSHDNKSCVRLCALR